MSDARVGVFLRMVAVGLLCFAIYVVAAGQTGKPTDAGKATDDRETLQALLAEVRSLRLALQTLQRMSLDTYRSQLLVDRIRVYREDVRRLSASLNETRDTLAKTQTTIPQFIDRQKLIENQAQAEVDQNKRAELEFDLRRTKEAVEIYKVQVETLREREQQLAAELNTEKSKLEDLESRLDLLERAIEDDRQKLEGNKAAPTKTP